MQLTRTTIRLEPPLKQAAQVKALELNINLQTLINHALKAYLKGLAKGAAKKIVFNSKAMGAKLDNLTRDDIYAD